MKRVGGLLILTIALVSCTKDDDGGDRFVASPLACASLVKEKTYLARDSRQRFMTFSADSDAEFVAKYLGQESNHDIEIAEPVYRVRTVEEPILEEPPPQDPPLLTDPVEELQPQPLPIDQPPTTETPQEPIALPAGAYDAVNAAAAWRMGYTGQGVVVGVVDAGLDISHRLIRHALLVNRAEAKGRAGYDDDRNGYIDDVYGWNFVDGSPDMDDEDGHGTHVAGIVVGARTSAGFRGIAEGAQVIGADFLTSEGGSTDSAVRAIQYVISRGARIVNASWTTSTCSTILEQAFQRWERQNKIVFVTAAGNSGRDLTLNPEYPSAFRSRTKINVGAATLNRTRASFSNYGRFVDVFAPGISILSAVPSAVNSSGMAHYDGSSMAAAFVSGAAALLLQANPRLTPTQVRNLIKERSYQRGSEAYLNLGATVQSGARLTPLGPR